MFFSWLYTNVKGTFHYIIAKIMGMLLLKQVETLKKTLDECLTKTL